MQQRILNASTGCSNQNVAVSKVACALPDVFHNLQANGKVNVRDNHIKYTIHITKEDNNQKNK